MTNLAGDEPCPHDKAVNFRDGKGLRCVACGQQFVPAPAAEPKAELPINKMVVGPHQILDLPTDNGGVAVANGSPHMVEVIVRRVVNQQAEPACEHDWKYRPQGSTQECAKCGETRRDPHPYG